MGKKTKSKQRLDAYYHHAKAQGYRSRAAFKLIQLNRKYNFLNNSTTLVDLCAAPGGWMQVAKQFMPVNSTIIGVDLDPIKKVPGAQSFIGDITTQTCWDTLKKMLKHQKCEVVLNDGAPNVGSDWSKDAYTQSELVLHALKLACYFLKQGGFFVTKVFRSTDFQSLMWVFKKFFKKVQATKPKASRFVSAEIFVVCCGYLAPEYIDDKLFDAKFIFKDTEADHYHEQMAGDITNIDRLLMEKRKRGGYEDNAPAHLYKQTSLTHFMNSNSPLLIFAEYNKITVSKEQKAQYYQLVKKMPTDMDQMFDDLKVLGRRQVTSIMKWRRKIKQNDHVENQKNTKKERKSSKGSVNDLEDVEQQMDSSDQLQMQVLQQKRKQIRSLRQKQNKKQQLLVKAQLGNEQHNEDQQLGSDFEMGSDIQLQQLGYEQQIYQQKPKQKRKIVIDYNAKQLEQNLEQMYETKRAHIEQKQQHAREVRQAKKDRREERYRTKQVKLKSRKIGPEQRFEEPEQQSKKVKNEPQFEQVKFRNPLADLQDDDLYISQNEEQEYDYKQNPIDPNEKMEGELSDDEAYVIPKPLTDMEKRRKQIKKNEKKKQRKLQKSVIEGEDTGGQIEIVKHKQMQDYDVDSLAQTLAIAKKMLRNRPREQIVENSYRGFSFEDHDDLPKWFADDEKKHNFKKQPITKQQFNQQKQRLMAINARIPKKIMQAKVRKKIRMQKKLKKVQKKAQAVMDQQGINQISKLRQVGKLYDAEKSRLKDKKKYVRTKKARTAKGKDTRNVKHVDARLKKDKRAVKLSKTRQINRKHKRKGKF